MPLVAIALMEIAVSIVCRKTGAFQKNEHFQEPPREADGTRPGAAPACRLPAADLRALLGNRAP